MTCPEPISQNTRPHKIELTEDTLLTFLKGYCEKLFTQQNQPYVLIQPYYNGREISAVYIGSKPYFIEKTKTEANKIAHEDFGGTSFECVTVSTKVMELAKKARNSLPRTVSDPPYIRFDIIQDGNKTPTLLEVEAGSSRLFLLELDAVEAYAEVLNKKVLEAKGIYNISKRGLVGIGT